jgi:hypothetical protein
VKKAEAKMGRREIEKELMNEAKKSDVINTVALAGAFIFMGIQFWPATYTTVMKMCMSAIFTIAGFFLIFVKFSSEVKGKKMRIFFMIYRWIISILAALAIVYLVVVYIRSGLSAT